MVANPLAGKYVYLDANPIIYAFENPDRYPGLVNNLLGALNRNEIQVVTSTITFTEVLTYPLRVNDHIIETAYRKFLTPSAKIKIVPVSSMIAQRAASIRAKFGLRTPDAIHVATYIQSNCDVFLSGDAALAKTGIHFLTPASL